MTTEEIFNGILLVLGGGTVASIVTTIANRRKTSAEADSTISKITLEYANMVRTDVDKLRDQLELAEKRNDEARIELEKTRTKLATSQAQIVRLEEIVKVAEQRDAKNRELITMLSNALKELNPAHPLIANLEKIA